MNKYPSYKETNIDWLGNLPSNWDCKKVGNFFIERSEKVDDKTYPALSVTKSGIVDQLEEVAKTNDSFNRKLVRKNDFVINSRSDRKGSAGISKRDGSVSLINIVLQPHSVEPKFIEYLLKSYYFKEEFFRNGKGIHWDLWTTRWDQLKNIYIPIPSTKEQKNISKFLDKKTEQIEKLIINIGEKVELLKEQKISLIHKYLTKGLDHNVEMKGTKFEWIGEVPSHWKLKSLKHISEIKLGKMLTPNKKKDMIYKPYLRSVNVQENKICLADVNYMWFYSDELQQLSLKKNDILVNEGGQVGRPCLLKNDVRETGFQNSINRIRVLNENTEFIYLFVYLSFKSGYYDCIVNRVSIPHLTKEKLENCLVLVPPEEEQKEISKFLNNKIEKIDRIIELEKKRISLLKESRESFISSAVTGKICITEEMI